MLRRRKRRPNSASSHPGLGLPKGPTRADLKRVKDAHERDVITETRLIVFTRDRACRCCAGKRRDAYLPDQMHELMARSKTRGMEPERRFNSQNCVRLCHLCHQDVTEKRIMVMAYAGQGADGHLSFLNKYGEGVYECSSTGSRSSGG